ncbi:MAG: hypothetical protein CL484_09705 [Acidobacteria bacterium]|nr:hypothetical protein [Acidobacteriota bacterium]
MKLAPRKHKIKKVEYFSGWIDPSNGKETFAKAEMLRNDNSRQTAGSIAPGQTAFTQRERRIISDFRTPRAVQRFLNALPYNTNSSSNGLTLRSFRGVIKHQTAHCLEAVLTAAVILEQHGYPPTVMSFESIDQLDHVIFVHRHAGLWGSVARSRDPGLHGRKPRFRTPRALALSYVEPYVDLTGRITGYAVVDLRDLGRYDWRFSNRNVWKVERMLLEYPHHTIRTSDHKISRWRTRYKSFSARFPGKKPMFFSDQNYWSELPIEFARPVGRGSTRRV